MNEHIEVERDPQAVILGCHALLDKAGIDPAHDWQGHITDNISHIRSRLAYRIHLAIRKTEIVAWDLDNIIATLRGLLEDTEGE